MSVSPSRLHAVPLVSLASLACTSQSPRTTCPSVSVSVHRLPARLNSRARPTAWVDEEGDEEEEDEDEEEEDDDEEEEKVLCDWGRVSR